MTSPVDLPADPAAPGSRTFRPDRFALWYFPAAVLALVVLLGTLGLQGSSLAIYSTELGAKPADAGVVAGTPRGIRSDEWYVRTPWVLRQAELGLPAKVAGGVGTHDMVVLGDLPTATWELVLRPHTAWYLVTDAERAFALEWWSYLAVQLLGVYALLAVLTKRARLSALGACLVTFSPATQWWSSPGTFTTIGYGSAATAALVAAVRQRTLRPTLGVAVLAGYLTALFLTTLYVPWQVGTALDRGAHRHRRAGRPLRLVVLLRG